MDKNSGSLRLVVMGVSGCGKSTLASALAQRLHLEMRDGDDLHLPASVDKMRAGIALNDSDRWPWLDRVGDYLAGSQGAGRVVACSALKRSYRDRLRARSNHAPLVFIFLNGDADLIAQRLAMRVGHYMQADLLQSQFKALEKPQSDEADVITVDIRLSIENIMVQVLDALKAHRAHERPAAALATAR